MAFSRKTKSDRYAHCKDLCEGCGAPLQVGHFDYHHDKARSKGGKDTFENCRVLCFLCHRPETAADIAWIAKSNRQRDKHIGAVRSARSLPAGRDSGQSKTMSGEVVPRRTQGEKLKMTLRQRSFEEE